MNRKQCPAARYISKNGPARLDFASRFWRYGTLLQSHEMLPQSGPASSWQEHVLKARQSPDNLTILHAPFNLLESTTLLPPPSNPPTIPTISPHHPLPHNPLLNLNLPPQIPHLPFMSLSLNLPLQPRFLPPISILTNNPLLQPSHIRIILRLRQLLFKRMDFVHVS